MNTLKPLFAVSIMIGIMAFYNPMGEEIKLKHFKLWKQVIKLILS